jgi:ribose/xylose/arabinose/galactoside ABC-type transport system permease subunit
MTGNIANKNFVFRKSFRSWFYGEGMIFPILVGLFFLGEIVSPRFLSRFNMVNLLRQGSFIILISLGQMLVILTKGIDLSVGSFVALSSVVSALTIALMGNWFLGILIPLLVTTGLGVFSGWYVTKSKIQPFVVTLAMMLLGRGLALTLSNETPIPIRNAAPLYGWLGRGVILDVLPVPLVLALVVIIVLWFFLSRTVLGRSIYAVGGDEVSAILMGINATRVKIVVYAMSGFLAGLSGVLNACRLATGIPTIGEGLELDSISAAVIGGTLLSGGYGGVLGAALGGLAVSSISNILNLAGITSWYQWVVRGIVLLGAIGLQALVSVKSSTANV